MRKVSLCVATYNCHDILPGALDSFLSQRGVELEILIADGGSKDGTKEIIDRYRGRVAWSISEPDAGIYDAWNKMLEKASGEWICFLGADDRFVDEHSLATFVDQAGDRPAGARLAYAKVRYIAKNGEMAFMDGKSWQEIRPLLKTKMCIPHVGALHHRSIFDDGFRFDSHYKISGDYDLVRREALRNGAYFVDCVHVIAGMGGISTHPQLQHLHMVEEGNILKRQTGSRPWVWHLRHAKILLRSTICRFAGHRGLANHDRIKKFEFLRSQSKAT